MEWTLRVVEPNGVPVRPIPLCLLLAGCPGEVSVRAEACDAGFVAGASAGAAAGAVCGDREGVSSADRNNYWMEVALLCQRAADAGLDGVATASAKSDDPGTCVPEADAEYLRCYDLAYSAAYSGAYPYVCDTGE